MNESSENTGISLLKKGKKGILSAVFSRMGLIILLLLVQVAIMFAVFFWFEDFLPHIYGGSILFSLFMAVYLLNTSMDPTGKITWLFIILLMPVFGALLYLYTQKNIGHRALQKRAQQMAKLGRDKNVQEPGVLEELRKTDPGAAGLADYIRNCGGYPVFAGSSVEYFPLGENKFEAQLRELRQAKDFIFLEYFIINEGTMWGQILEILAEKAKEGVDVRLMYDGTLEFSALPHDYPKRLETLGIKCRVFAPLTPFVSTHYNYRDHRKILVVDGHTAFTGGVNLSDEYINRYERFGHWKDTAIMVKGDAVKSFTLMFLETWSMTDKQPDFGRFLEAPTCPPRDSRGFVIPYGDCPLDSYKVGEQVYMDILNRATRYVHIMTPYLILDGEMENALIFAAQRGVDVELILPGIPDKNVPFALAYTHYRALTAAGIKIYEYTPGFVHAKSFVADDREAVVGTINLDYRSLYHHFECAAWMYRTAAVPDVEKDFAETREKCRAVTRETIRHEKFSRKATGFLVKVLAPLL